MIQKATSASVKLQIIPIVGDLSRCTNTPISNNEVNTEVLNLWKNIGEIILVYKHSWFSCEFKHLNTEFML